MRKFLLCGKSLTETPRWAAAVKVVGSPARLASCWRKGADAGMNAATLAA